MIQYNPKRKGAPFKIPPHYKPHASNFQTGTFIVNGVEFFEYDDEFVEALKRARMWEKLQA